MSTTVPAPVGTGQTLINNRLNAAWWALEADLVPVGWSIRVKPSTARVDRASSNPITAMPAGSRYVIDAQGAYVPAIRTPANSPRPGSDAANQSAAFASSQAASVNASAAMPTASRPIAPVPAVAPVPALVPTAPAQSNNAAAFPGQRPAVVPTAAVPASPTPQTPVVTSGAQASTAPVGSFAMPPVGGTTTIGGGGGSAAPLPSLVKSNTTGTAKEGVPVALIVAGVALLGVLLFSGGKKTRRRRKRRSRR